MFLTLGPLRNLLGLCSLPTCVSAEGGRAGLSPPRLKVSSTLLEMVVKAVGSTMACSRVTLWVLCWVCSPQV